MEDWEVLISILVAEIKTFSALPKDFPCPSGKSITKNEISSTKSKWVMISVCYLDSFQNPFILFMF
jgi:hypothetical protein